MRTRDTLLSHAMEVRFGSGSNSLRTGPTTWPNGCRRIGLEVNCNGGGAVQPLDSEVDYRDRWLVIDSNLINRDFYDPFLNGFIVLPTPPGPLNASLFNYPYDVAMVTTEDIAVLKSEILYSALGWDGGSLPRGTAPNQNFAQLKHFQTNLFLNVFIYADNFTGGLMLKNNTGTHYEGFLIVEAWEQLGAMVIVP